MCREGSRVPGKQLLNLFMNGVGIAMGAEFLQLHATRGIATILHGRVAGHAIGSLVGIGATLSAL